MICLYKENCMKTNFSFHISLATKYLHIYKTIKKLHVTGMKDATILNSPDYGGKKK